MSQIELEPATITATIRLHEEAAGVFIRDWLGAALDADAVLKRARLDHKIDKELGRLETCVDFEFEQSAVWFLRMAMAIGNVEIASHSYEAELLTIFTQLGFFRQHRGKWVFRVPGLIDRQDISEAILSLIETEDDGRMLHPETLPPFSTAR